MKACSSGNPPRAFSVEFNAARSSGLPAEPFVSTTSPRFCPGTTWLWAAQTNAGYFPASRTPNRPASSCVNCQATRPEREPRVVDHSSASRSSSASSILMPKWLQ